MSKKGQNHIAPPKLADRFLSWFCRSELLEEVKGDLHEFYRLECEQHSKVRANLKYYYHVFNFVRPFAIRSIKRSTGQLYLVFTYLNLAIRGFRKSPLFHGLNTIGLALGIAACLLIALFIQKENAYDQNFTQADQIYRIETDIFSATGTRHIVRSAPAQGPAFQSELAGVKAFTRIRHGDTGDPQLMQFQDQSFFENRIFYVDSTFLQIFDFALAVGNEQTALFEPNSVVLTWETAKKYFGEGQALGKILTLDQNKRLKVTGVLKPIKKNTHLTFDFLISMNSYQPPAFGGLDRWNWSTFYSYLLLEPGVDSRLLESQIPEILTKNWRVDANENVRLSLKPLSKIYLNSPDDDQVLGETSSALYSTLLLIIGLFIFLNCAFNHVNITTAKALNRAKEVGVRKVLGAWNVDLRSQFVLESIFHVVISIILSLLFAFLFLKVMGSQLGLGLDVLFIEYAYLLKLLGIMFLILVPASSGYLTLVMSRVSPSQVFRGSGIKSTSGSSIRRVLITAQIGMSFLLLIGSFAVVNQLKFIYGKDLGFSKDQVLIFELNGEQLLANYENLKGSLLANPYVKSVGAARLGMEGRHGSYRVFPLEGEPSEEGHQMSIYPVQYDFFETLDINISEGRSYSRAFPLDTTHQFIINETAKRQLGFDDPVGKRIMLNGQGGMYGTVVGVAEDFHFKSLAFGLDPMVIFLRENAANFVYVKLSANDFTQAISSIEDSWSSVNGNFPFDFQFLDERINANYELDLQFQQLINFFSILIVLITAIGLFGMSAHTVKQRTKELIIRRILGARLTQMIGLLSKDFTVMVVVAFIITTPLAIYGTDSWLKGFAYRTALPWTNYVLLFLAIGLLMLAIVGLNTLMVSRKNTIDNLRNE